MARICRRCRQPVERGTEIDHVCIDDDLGTEDESGDEGKAA